MGIFLEISGIIEVLYLLSENVLRLVVWLDLL